MTYKEAVKSFEEYYLKDGSYDYWTVYEMWDGYTDGLCKSGEITQRQYSNWSTPYKYGKDIIVYHRKVVTQK